MKEGHRKPPRVLSQGGCSVLRLGRFSLASLSPSMQPVRVGHVAERWIERHIRALDMHAPLASVAVELPPIMSPPRAHSHRHDGRHHRNDDTDAVVHSNLMRKAVNFFNEIHMRGRALAHAESAECLMEACSE